MLRVLCNSVQNLSNIMWSYGQYMWNFLISIVSCFFQTIWQPSSSCTAIWRHFSMSKMCLSKSDWIICSKMYLCGCKHRINIDNKVSQWAVEVYECYTLCLSRSNVITLRTTCIMNCGRITMHWGGLEGAHLVQIFRRWKSWERGLYRSLGIVPCSMSVCFMFWPMH